LGKRTDCARCNLSAVTGGLEIGIFDVSTMYEKVKNVAKKVLPRRFIDRNEGFLRKLVAITYRGSEYECAICGFHMSKFVVLDNGNKLCPRCGSLPRTRRLFTVLNSEIGIQNKSILHFSPPGSIAERIRKENPEEYLAADFEGEFQAAEKIDITCINKSDKSYDLIICYHVLEHVLKDDLAISELFRVLRKGGACLIQTPFKEGDTYENVAMQTPSERRTHFGQEDHVRVYSVNGISEKLTTAGFNVKELVFNTDPANRMGFSDNETILVATKT
jgi:SAM-dependent methyltransferase